MNGVHGIRSSEVISAIIVLSKVDKGCGAGLGATKTWFRIMYSDVNETAFLPILESFGGSAFMLYIYMGHRVVGGCPLSIKSFCSSDIDGWEVGFPSVTI